MSIQRISLIAVMVLLLGAPRAWSQQRVQFPQPTGTAGAAPTSGAAPIYNAQSPYGAAAPGYVAPGQAYAAPVGGNPTSGGLINVPPLTNTPAGGYPPAAFDPYSTVPNAASVPPSLPVDPSLAPYGANPYGANPYGANPYGASPGGTTPGAVAPYGANPYGTNPYGAAPFGASPGATLGAPPGTYPPGAFPQSAPNSLYPNGFGGNPIQPAPWGPPLRLLYGPRLRASWIMPEAEPDALGINDFDTSVAMAWPNFFGTGQAVFLIPSFSLHLWDGPKPPNPSDLPSKAYSAFLDVGWQSDVQKQAGLELGARVGVFSDFDTFNTNSVRYLGQAMGRLRISPTLTLRLGAAYINRNRIKLLPVGGFLWEPNAMTRFDIFFPEPKLAQYLTTVGNQSVWWYLGGEYGGGSWTIERAADFSDRIDINDIRVKIGLEWGEPSAMAQGRRKAFLEAAWVTEREVIYVVTPDESFDVRDSLMLRAGFGY